MADDLEKAANDAPGLDLHPSLAEVVSKEGLTLRSLAVRPKLKGDKLDVSARDEILIADDDKTALWKVPSVRALFRGDKVPPKMPGEPPPEYLPLFYFIEQHVVTFCSVFGDKTDGEFEEAYSNLRRRPDGKSFSDLHFFVWQVAAVLVGTRVVSAAEFEGIFGRLTLSAATFRMGVVSRNYITTLRNSVY